MKSSLRGCKSPLRPIAAALIAIFGLSPLESIAAPAVTNCSDGGDGSLRQSVIDASDTDTIDLTQLRCTITLTTGAIVITQSDLTIYGPGSDKLTIDGSQNSGGYNIFLQTSTGNLNIHDMAVRHGTLYLNNPHKYVGGGCIFSSGTVAIYDSIVSDCKMITGPDAAARGGAVAARNIRVTRSVISGNRTYHGQAYGNAHGGGLFATGQIFIDHSMVADNTASSVTEGQAPNLYGGGLWARDSVGVYYSTISGNAAQAGSALYCEGRVYIAESTISGNRGFNQGAIVSRSTVETASIVNSTISGNTASRPVLDRYGPAQISNSTIAFNISINNPSGTAIAMHGNALTLYSSIVADNFPGDVYIDSDSSLTGAYNLIVNTSAPLLAATITSCPRLEPLANNGGQTLTHALQHTSPAIDTGLNLMGMALPFDQRGNGYPRIYGPRADVGAIERRGEAENGIFDSGFDFTAGFCELR